MISIQVEVQRNPRTPEARYFIISGREQTIKEPVTLKSIEEAHEVGSEIAEYAFGIRKAKEVRFFSYEGQDRIGIFLNDEAEWEKSNDARGATTIERTVQQFIKNRISLEHPILLNTETAPVVISGNGSLLEEMEIHLQKIKPPLVEKHGGRVRAVDFEENKGVLTIQFGKTCATGCPESPYGTRLAISPRMRSRFPQIREVVFTSDLG